MGDSDEEYDRRRRDKFRGERNDYDNRRPAPNRYDRGGRGGDRMSGHGNWDRGKRDYYSSKDQGGRDRRDSFGRGSSPPPKRSKRDWESCNDGHPWRGQQDTNALVPQDKSSSGTPMLMSFKDFIMQQEDDIDEVESVRRYQEYKVEFKRTQINDFFVLHKNEEWFEEKYHPVKSVRRNSAVRHSMRRRLRVFLDLWEAGYLDNMSLSLSENEAVLKILDRVVIKLEGGSEEDVKAIDFPPQEDEKKSDEVDAGVTKKQDLIEEQTKKEEEEAKEPLPPGMEDEEEPLPPGMEDEENVKMEDEQMDQKEKEDIKKEDIKKEDEKEAVVVESKPEEKKYIYDGSHMKHSLSVFMRQVPANITRADLIGVCKRYPGFLRVAMSEPSAERRFARRAWASFEHDVNIKDINWSMSNIRIKDTELSPVVNRDVTNRVRAVNGITCSPVTMQLDLKFALKLVKKLDERTKLYEKVDIVENGHPEEDKKEDEVKKEEETGEKDKEEEETKKAKEEEEDKLEVFNIPESNPIVDKLPDDIEEVVTGLDLENGEDDSKEYPVVVNEEFAKQLDLLLLYLRVVHCIDYYNSNEYAHEDEMPMRCGILHVRGPTLEAASKKDVHEWYNQIHSKLDHILNDETVLATDEESLKLGKKKEEIEVDNFIKANTQELAKDKWLCPLSGKKFRGPEFVKKHIMMKHLDSVDNVKTEVKFFNNYIYDMKRPCFPDAKAPSRGEGRVSSYSSNQNSNNATWNNNNHSSRQPQPTIFTTPRPAYQASNYQPTTPQSAPLPDTYGRVNTYPPKGIKRSGGGMRDRRLIKYRDLDAPEESDFF